MRKILAKTDYGEKATFDKWTGKFYNESDLDDIIHVTEDTAIMRPDSTLDGEGVPIAYIVTNAFPNDDMRDFLYGIEDSSVMRANCSGPINKAEMAAKNLIEGRDYKLRTANSYHVRTKDGKRWGMIAYGSVIHSIMIGYKRGRFTGAIDASGWTKDNPDKFEILKEISFYNEKAFDKANPVVYNKQRKFAESFVKPEHRMGIFTTLSANRYHAGQSTKMGAHVDSGDTEFGMTSMCVFRQGDYQGAYLIFPRYGIGIDAPDNSVIIADSREIHGVSPIRGNGERFSCVAYCDLRLATIGVAGKSERKIGRFAKKEIGNLEEFF